MDASLVEPFSSLTQQLTSSYKYRVLTSFLLLPCQNEFQKDPQSVCAPSSPCFEQRIWLFFLQFFFSFRIWQMLWKTKCRTQGIFFGDLQPQASPLSMSAGLPFYLWSSFLKYFGLSLQIVPVLIEYRGFLLICCHWQFMSLKRGSTTCMCLF